MDELINAVLGSMQKGETPPVAILARIGDPEPAEAAEALRHAASLPELAAEADRWVPTAMKSAYPGRSAVRLAELVVEGRATGRDTPERSQLPALAALLGSGDPIADWVRERPDWSTSRAIGEAVKPPRPVWSEIRDAHIHGLLQLGSRWLLGAPVSATLAALSQLADGCMAAAVECAAGETGITPPAVMAWGRFGAGEPGLVSGLELLLVDPASGDAASREESAFAVDRLLEELPQYFEAGITWSFGPADAADRSGSGVQALPDAVAYWRERACLRDRAALASLRQVAGSSAVAADFGRQIGALLDLNARETAERDAAWKHRVALFEPDDALRPEADLLAGPCGMGTLERVVGALALHEGLRGPATLPDRLASIAARLPAVAAATRGLAAAHGWLRRAELGLGMLAAPSAVIPADSGGQLALARTMGYADSDARRALARFLYDWRAVRDEVYEIADRLCDEMEN